MKKKILSIVVFLVVSFVVYMWPDPDYQLDLQDVVFVETSLLCGGGIAGMAIYPFVVISKCLSKKQKGLTVTHELVHIVQIKREGWLFYIKYQYYNWRNFFKDLNWYLRYVYRQNPYEDEAFRSERKKP